MFQTTVRMKDPTIGTIITFFVIDAKSGALDKKIKFTADARNDKGEVMEISDKYVTLLTFEYNLIDLQTEKIYRGKDFEKLLRIRMLL